LFPSVSKFIEEFKKCARANDTPNGEGAFAVTLQRMEAGVFIDTLYYQLKKMGYWVKTRHDSLLIKNEDEILVRQHIKAYFDSISFACSFK